MKRPLYLILGHFFVVLGFVGAFLPVLPTTPFALLAAYFYSRSSPRFHAWLINLPLFGGPIRDWHNRGVIRLRAKIVATLMMVLLMGHTVWFREFAIVLKGLMVTVGVSVLLFIWTRPSGPKEQTHEDLLKR